jgi:hypothetical protein
MRLLKIEPKRLFSNTSRTASKRKCSFTSKTLQSQEIRRSLQSQENFAERSSQNESEVGASQQILDESPAIQCTFTSITQASGHFPAAVAGGFDDQGVLYCIGTSGGTRKYTNPHSSGEVRASMSSLEEGNSMLGRPSRFLTHHHDGRIGNCTDVEQSPWMAVDLGEGRTLVTNHYALRHGAPTGRNTLCNWKLEASNDAQTWVTLQVHVNDYSLPQDAGYGVAAWPIEGVTVAYRHFRIVGSGMAQICSAGIELYGELLRAGVGAPSRSEV